MIEFSELLIESVEDYNKLYECVGKEAIDEQAVDTLKKFLGTKCNRIVVEYPYHDKDFLSTYYCYYFRKNAIAYILWEKMKNILDILF